MALVEWWKMEGMTMNYEWQVFKSNPYQLKNYTRSVAREFYVYEATTPGQWPENFTYMKLKGVEQAVPVSKNFIAKQGPGRRKSQMNYDLIDALQLFSPIGGWHSSRLHLESWVLNYEKPSRAVTTEFLMVVSATSSFSGSHIRIMISFMFGP